MFKKAKLIGLFSILMAIPTTVVAHSGWADILTDVNYTGKLTYRNAGHTYQYNHNSDKFKSIIGKAEQLQTLKDSLSEKVRAVIQKQISGKLSLRNYKFSLSGPITLTLTGRDNGTVNARFGGFSIHSKGKLRKNSLMYAHYTLDTNTFWLNGDYNIYTGQISNVKPDASFNANVDVDVDSIFDLIPLFNSLVTQYAEDTFVAAAKAAIRDQLNNTASYEKVVFGLDAKLPSNVYVYKGRDFGKEVKDSFAELISGESITITLTTKARRFMTTQGYYRNYIMDKVSFNVSNHLFLDFNETPTYRKEWVCFKRPCTKIP